jgi:hypothetical protein
MRRHQRSRDGEKRRARELHQRSNPRRKIVKVNRDSYSRREDCHIEKAIGRNRVAVRLYDSIELYDCLTRHLARSLAKEPLIFNQVPQACLKLARNGVLGNAYQSRSNSGSNALSHRLSRGSEFSVVQFNDPKRVQPARRAWTLHIRYCPVAARPQRPLLPVRQNICLNNRRTVL